MGWKAEGDGILSLQPTSHLPFLGYVLMNSLHYQQCTPLLQPPQRKTAYRTGTVNSLSQTPELLAHRSFLGRHVCANPHAPVKQVRHVEYAG